MPGVPLLTLAHTYLAGRHPQSRNIRIPPRACAGSPAKGMKAHKHRPPQALLPHAGFVFNAALAAGRVQGQKVVFLQDESYLMPVINSRYFEWFVLQHGKGVFTLPQNKVKGSDVLAVKKILREKGEVIESRMLNILKPEAQRIYKEAVPTSWIPQNEESEIFCAAAEALFPGREDGIQELGRLIAKYTMSTIYKAFLRIPTVDFIIDRAGYLWDMNMGKGKTAIERHGEKQGVFKVTEYPELLPVQGKEIAGYICGILDMTRAKNPQVTFQGNNPAQWEWHIRWE
ncbi:hypothetical protein JW933_09540 [candidate division FCPU426 bacterium]|nr:hypothetical protein [candidate division FCPU426 bacterium]